MDFTLETWKQAATERLHKVGDWLEQRKKEDAPYLLYGFLGTMTLMPLVEALQAGQLLPAMIALNTIAAGVGGNLVAEYVQRLKDRADKIDEAKEAELLAKLSASNSDLRDALDTILEGLDTIPQTQATLDEADQQWFTETLRGELAQLGNLGRFEANMRSVVIGRDLQQGVVVAGDNNSVNYIIHQYRSERYEYLDETELRHQVNEYLTWMRDRYGTIELRGIKREGQQVVQLNLEMVYVPLEAQIYDWQTISIELNQVLDLGKRIIITGGPGCGKTTVMMHIAWTLATAIATDNPTLAWDKLGSMNLLSMHDILNWSSLCTKLYKEVREDSQNPGRRIQELLLRAEKDQRKQDRQNKKKRDKRMKQVEQDKQEKQEMHLTVSSSSVSEMIESSMASEYLQTTKRTKVLERKRTRELLQKEENELQPVTVQRIIRDKIRPMQLFSRILQTAESDLTLEDKSEFITLLNNILNQKYFYQESSFDEVALPDEVKEFLSRNRTSLSRSEIQRLNRLLLETYYPQEIAKCRWLPLPIFVPLNAYAAFLRHLSPVNDPRNRTLASFISRYLVERQISFNLPEDFFQQLMRDGQTVILLLDGLDEVPNEAERVRVRQAIEELVTGREGIRVVVTCRTAAYKNRTALGKGFREVRVKPLDDNHIETMVRQAYAHIYRHDSIARKKKSDELLDGIRRLEEERRRVRDKAKRLISSPLLVRMLLVVHFSERRLPEQRAELYMKATDAMLLPEYSLDEEIADRIGQLVGGSRERHRDLVQHLAFAMHHRGKTQGREISEDDLRRTLNENSSYEPLIDDFITLTRHRGTLLEERLGVYRFIHLAFQEFLVARYLAEIVRGEGGVDGIVTFLEKGPMLDSWWREPILLVTGYLSISSPQTAEMFLRRLAGIDAQAAQRGRELSHNVMVAAIELAIIALLEWQPRSNMYQELLGQLVSLLEDTDLPPSQRVIIGNILVDLGDPRPGVGLDSDTGLPGIVWCPVPSGPFTMGEGKDKHILKVTSYLISRYPVTNAQFKAFVDDGGYYTSEFWHKVTGIGLWKRGKPVVDYDPSFRPKRRYAYTEYRDGELPVDYDLSFQPLNHPIVDISWYEAIAFCRWLTKKWQAAGSKCQVWMDGEIKDLGALEDAVFKPLVDAIRHSSFVIRLPTEAEWEKAARGTDGWVYPWGNEFDATRCNMRETGIGMTSAVGIFAASASPYGVLDLSGNVQEWTSSLALHYPYKANDTHENMSSSGNRVLRGGYYENNKEIIRCSFRGIDSPSRYNGFTGFRVVMAVSSSLDELS